MILAPGDYARWLGEEPDPRDLMRPFQGYSSITQTAGWLNRTYHSLQLKAESNGNGQANIASALNRPAIKVDLRWVMVFLLCWWACALEVQTSFEDR